MSFLPALESTAARGALAPRTAAGAGGAGAGRGAQRPRNATATVVPGGPALIYI